MPYSPDSRVQGANVSKSGRYFWTQEGHGNGSYFVNDEKDFSWQLEAATKDEFDALWVRYSQL